MPDLDSNIHILTQLTEDENGNLALEFPDEIIEAMDWKEIHLQSKSLQGASSSESYLKMISELQMELDLTKASRNRCDDL